MHVELAYCVERIYIYILMFVATPCKDAMLCSEHHAVRVDGLLESLVFALELMVSEWKYECGNRIADDDAPVTPRAQFRGSHGEGRDT